MKEKRPVGRPSKYKEEYCQMLIDHMASGLSFLSFAAVIDVHEDTIVEWSNAHAEFSLAKKIAFSKSRLFTERALNALITGENPDSNVTAVIFSLKNRFPKEWRDRQEIEQNVTSENKHEISVDIQDRIDQLKRKKEQK